MARGSGAARGEVAETDWKISPAFLTRRADNRRSAILFGAMLATPLSRLRFVGILEGVSYLLLLGVAMPLKYFMGEPLAVRAVGMAHGVLFMLYLLALVPVALDYKWSWKTVGLGVLASIMPAGPFVFDHKVLRGMDRPQA